VFSTWSVPRCCKRDEVYSAQLRQHKIRKIGVICFAKPVLSEDMYIVQKEVFFNNMLYVRYVRLTEGQAYS
jgi:hypothetical protein